MTPDNPGQNNHNETHDLIVFTDGSVNTKSKTGYGACLIIPEQLFTNESFDNSDFLKKKVHLKKFKNTSSTRLELQSVLWAISMIRELNDQESSLKKNKTNRVVFYTDSQNILSLKERRERLEKNEYRSKKNRRLKNHDLYQAFFRLTDTFNHKFVKVSGHKVSNEKNMTDKFFSIVDRASRNDLREDFL
jgi:ribonuclease HI